MSKKNILTGTIISAVGALTSGLNLSAENPRQAETMNDANSKEISINSHPYANLTTAIKRAPTQVYHRFEEIPEISDTEALLYTPQEYTYIINADVYQKTGKIELKRVLTDEITKTNALSLIYRSECGDRTPRPNEDQIAKYDIDVKLLNPTAKYKGPSQLNDDGVLMFARYLAADPESRQYVKPLLKSTNGSLDENLQQLEKKFFNSNGSLRPMSERDAVLMSKIYQSIRFKDNAWQQLASPKLKKFIAKEEAKRHTHLTNTTKNYLCMTELFPDQEMFIRKLEDFNLSCFPLGRPGKPKHVMAALARTMNLKDEHGNLNATRIPLAAIAASISHINWKGNGKAALSSAQQKLLSSNYELRKKELYRRIKTWVSGKGRAHGVDELARLNMITPTHIRQYTEIELPGAKELAKEYERLVQRAELKLKLAAEKNNMLSPRLITKNYNTTDTNLKKTLVLTPNNFSR